MPRRRSWWCTHRSWSTKLKYGAPDLSESKLPAINRLAWKLRSFLSRSPRVPQPTLFWRSSIFKRKSCQNECWRISSTSPVGETVAWTYSKTRSTAILALTRPSVASALRSPPPAAKAAPSTLEALTLAMCCMSYSMASSETLKTPSTKSLGRVARSEELDYWDLRP